MSPEESDFEPDAIPDSIVVNTHDYESGLAGWLMQNELSRFNCMILSRWPCHKVTSLQNNAKKIRASYMRRQQ